MAKTLVAAVLLAAAAWLATVVLWTAVAHARFHAFHRREGLSYPPLPLRGWVRFYVRTVVSVALVWAWWLRSFLGGSPRAVAGRSSREPVLCVHGFFMGKSSLWGLRRSLERRGRRTAGVFLGLPYRGPGTYARSLRRRMEELLEATPDARLDAVAHSMGGLVLRQVLADAPDLAERVRRVVTLGTPHHGTGLLRRLRSGPVHRMMARGAPYVRELATFAKSAPDADVTTVASRHDLVVYPVETAYLEGAERITLEGIGHLGLLTERELHELVAERLAPPEA